MMERATWTSDRLGDAVLALAQAAGIPARGTGVRFDAAGVNEADRERWVERIVAAFGLEAESVEAPYADLDRLLCGAGPALWSLEWHGRTRLAAILRANRRRAVLVGRDGLHEVATGQLRKAITRPLEASTSEWVDGLLSRARIQGPRRARARDAVLRQRLGDHRVRGCWVLRHPAHAPFVRQLRSAGVMRILAELIVSHVFHHVLELASWWMLGRGALQGRLDPGWLAGWALLLVSQTPLRLLERRAQGRISIEAGALLKRRLMQGAIAMAPEQMRHEGAGQLLGRTVETTVLESMAASGGLVSGMAVVDLVGATGVLAFGARGALHPALLVAWLAIGAMVARRYWNDLRTWTDQRLSLTHDLVERMVGHRTRMAQQPKSEWHAGEDAELARYLAASRELDRARVFLTIAIPAGWLVTGLATLAPVVVGGAATTPVTAISLGGLLLAYRALGQLATGMRSLALWALAWRRAKMLFDAGGLAERSAAPELPSTEGTGSGPDASVLSAHDLVFRYRAGAKPVLRECSLRITAGDRVLLEGPSGSGKSTLAHVLAAVRAPESGTVLLGGRDGCTLGSTEWRRRVVAVPQFHENHVFSSTLAFNLLMGRRWPPRSEDLRDAEEVCRELGLGRLIEEMPSGLQQMVGETGWQLSHGERSRVYIARALLQSSDVLLLDESFAALDPESMNRAVECVMRRARALLVIAHP
jgi:ATP-binding cassette subfamily B protein